MYLLHLIFARHWFQYRASAAPLHTFQNNYSRHRFLLWTILLDDVFPRYFTYCRYIYIDIWSAPPARPTNLIFLWCIYIYTFIHIFFVHPIIFRKIRGERCLTVRSSTTCITHQHHHCEWWPGCNIHGIIGETPVDPSNAFSKLNGCQCDVVLGDTSKL